MKETKISYYKIQYPLYEAEICFPEKKCLAVADVEPKVELQQECAITIRSAARQLPRKDPFSRAGQHCSVWLLGEAGEHSPGNTAGNAPHRQRSLPPQPQGRGLALALCHTLLLTPHHWALLHSFYRQSLLEFSSRLESELHSASNRTPEEQRTLGVEGEEEPTNESEDKNCSISVRTEHSVKTTVPIHHRMRTPGEPPKSPNI